MSHLLFILTLTLTLCTGTPAFAGLNDFLNKINAASGGKLEAMAATKLSDTKIGDGLKEALRVGIDNAVKLTGKTDGYFKNEAIKILLPESLQKMDKLLRTAGFSKQLDEFVLSMNRSAEAAAPFAKDIFIKAIADMSFKDVQSILNGGNTAATDYLKQKTYANLSTAFKPAVQKSLDQFAVTKKYNDVMKVAKALPFGKNLTTPEADQYVVGKALDGLFKVLSLEETKIRQDPQARVTDLLKEVFKNQK